MKKISAVFVLYLLVLMGVYWTALPGGPIMDDFRVLHFAKSGGWLDASPGSSALFWRPLVAIFIKIEWLTFHLNFWGYRLVSLCLCAITALAIAQVLLLITKNRAVGVVAGLLFVLWPTHPETVLWIAGQTDGIATCFAWLALWAFVDTWTRPNAQPWRTVLWLLPLCAALLSKESVIVMPLLIFLFAVVLKREHKRRDYLLVAGTMAALTFGYLVLRGRMLDQPLLGGGYQSDSSHGLLSRVFQGLLDYHLNFNLLNAYAPLSNRLFPGLPPDAMVTILMVFGIGAIVRQFTRREHATRPTALYAIAGFLAMSAWIVFGVYPVMLIVAVTQEPTGLVGIVAFAVVIAVAVFRYHAWLASIGKRTQSVLADHPIYPMVAVTLIAAFIVARWFKTGVPNDMLFIFSVSYWLVMFSTRPADTEQDSSSISAPVPRLVLLMAAASVIALIPILTIKQVDGNLAIARLSYLATTFSVPAIVLGIWALVRHSLVRGTILTAVGALLILAGWPVIRTWSQSERISSSFVDYVQKTEASKIYVLAQPSATPTATALVLGGEFLSDSGSLLRNDDLQVLPAYYIEGFAQGDLIKVTSTGKNSWHIALVPGGCTYRSSKLFFASCQGSSHSAFPFAGILATDRTLDIRIANLDPRDAVVIVDAQRVVDLSPPNH